MDDDQESGGQQEKTVTGEGKLLIKLKIPQVKEEEQSFQSQSQPQVQITRVCEVCNKGFSSGKALGGHMRIHVQANKEKAQTHQEKLKPIKKIIKHHYQHQERDGDEENYDHDVMMNSKKKSKYDSTCSICEKTFPSMKSLFGHLRCHPERPWRGIQPRPLPPAKASPSSSAVSDSVSHYRDFDNHDVDDEEEVSVKVTDLTKLLPGWVVRDRRGRLSVSKTEAVSSSAMEEDEDEDEMLDAVEDLMTLAKGNSLDQSEPEFEPITNSMVYESKQRMTDTLNQVMVEKRGSTSTCLMEKAKGKGVLVQESMNYRLGNTDWHDYDYKDQLTDYESDSDDNDNASAENMDYKCESVARPALNQTKKRRKKINLKDLEPAKSATMATTGGDKYKCSTCHKTFPTHQALGGHRSSHNKVKNAVQDSLPPATEDHEKPSHHEGGASSMLVAESSFLALHECQICHKTFPTGQALGGHKRCHWTGPVEASQTGRKVLEFDLNELPAMEEEEEEFEGAEAGGNYSYPSSSSYNSIP